MLILIILHEIMDMHEAEALDLPTVLEEIPETVCEEESAFNLDEEVRKKENKNEKRPANRKRSGKRRKPTMKVRPANRKIQEKESKKERPSNRMMFLTKRSQTMKINLITK
jgi:hypothetical protein